MPYYHNMIGGPSDVEGLEDVNVTVKRPANAGNEPNWWDIPADEETAETHWNTPDMMKHRASHTVSELKSTGITILDQSLGGHTEGNSLN